MFLIFFHNYYPTNSPKFILPKIKKKHWKLNYKYDYNFFLGLNQTIICLIAVKCSSHKKVAVGRHKQRNVEINLILKSMIEYKLHAWLRKLSKPIQSLQFNVSYTVSLVNYTVYICLNHIVKFYPFYLQLSWQRWHSRVHGFLFTNSSPFKVVESQLTSWFLMQWDHKLFFLDHKLYS